MGAIADLAVPQGGAVAALPVPGEAVTPEQLDVNTFNATAGPFRQGLRSGMNSLGANMNALIGQTGETLGLTEFAADRFKDAENYADFADRVGPPVRDFGQVKSAESLAKFVAGITGEALATSLPAVGASLALRRPVAGITAGTLPFSAGQQITRERADPNSTATPGEVLTHGLEKGAVDSALYASLGGVGQGVKKILSPKTAAKGSMTGALAEGALGNAAAGAGSSVAGDVIAKQGNPDQEISYDDALNAAIGGAVPGAILSGAGHAVGALPGKAARSADELRTRLGKKERPPTGEPRLEDIKEDSSVDDIANMLKDGEENVTENLTNVWNKIKDHPGAQKFKDWATDPDQREAFNAEIQKKYSDSEYKPKVDAALETGKKWYDGAKKYLAERGQKNDVKKSEMRTKVDDDIHDAMLEAMPVDYLQATEPKQLLELGGIIKQMAENPDYFAETGVPATLKKVFGDQFGPLMEKAVERVHGPESRKAAMDTIKGVFKKHNDMEGMQTEEVQNLVRTHLKPEYLANPELRKAAMEELAPKLLDYVNRRGKTDDVFHAGMKEAFAKPEDVMAGLDRLQSEAQTNKVFEHGVAEDSHPAADQRLNKNYTDIADADKARAELLDEYGGSKNVKIYKEANEDGTIGLRLEAADEVGLDKEAFAMSRESATHNRSGLENGILTVKTDTNPQGAKINLVNLTREMIRREGHLTQDGPTRYLADMVKRGIASLVNTEGFRDFTDHSKGQLIKGKDGSWDLPDTAMVARRRVMKDGKPVLVERASDGEMVPKTEPVTYGDLKNASKVSKWDIAGFTKEDVIEHMKDIANHRETRKQQPLGDKALRQEAIKRAMESTRAKEMQKTLADRMEINDNGEQQSDSTPTLASRDRPIDEAKGRQFEEDTGRPIGEGGKKAAPGDPGPVYEPLRDEILKAKATKLPPGPKFSAMNIGKGEVTPEQIKAVKDYVAKVLGTKKTEVLFEKMKHAGEFAKLDGVETMKISIDSADPMSVGYHESVHALVARLMKADPKAAHTLMRAASAAPIVARLRELLAGHPGALKQLADPEERLAYMYQFWASGEKGLLSIGPNTRTWFEKVKGFFGKIGAVWADDMGSAQAVQRANDMLLAFHNGEFSERSTVAKVMAERFPPDPETQLRKFWPGLGKFMDNVIYTAGGSVRDMNFAPMTEIMDKFHTKIADQGTTAGFNQVKRVEVNRFMNRVVEAIRGMDDAQKAALVEELQSGKDRTSPAAKAIEQINKDLFKYMVEKGVKVWADGKYIDLKEITKNYWHRIPNSEYLRTASGKEAFIEMLQKNKVKDPDSVYNKWAQEVESGSPKEDGVLGLSFFTPQINERTLQNIPDADIAPFLEKDLFGTMQQYTQRAVRRAEYAERFGNRGEVIESARKAAAEQGATPAQLKVFDSAVQAHEGTLGADINPKQRAVYAALMTYQNIRLLPLQLFSSFVDPLGIVVRGGTLNDAGKGFLRGIRELVGVKEDASHYMAKTIGSITTAFDEGLASDMANAQFMPAGAKWVSEKFFKYNGMESWNRSLRIAATQAAHDFIVRHVEAPTEHSERMLAQLNLKAKDIKIADGTLDVHNPKIAEAMNRWVNEAILTPNAAHRPIYMSDPHYMLISHLKQYSYLFQKVIINRVHDELKHGNYSPAYALVGYVPAIIAADMMRMAITPTPNDNSARASWTALDWLWSGVQRAGIFGPGQMGIGTAMDTRQNRIPGQNLLGPTVEQLVDFARATAQGTGVGNELINAVPGLKLIKGTGHETLPVGDE